MTYHNKNAPHFNHQSNLRNMTVFTLYVLVLHTAECTFVQ